jgi:putative spermidine/putrescine transport system ATP-binding protein
LPEVESRAATGEKREDILRLAGVSKRFGQVTALDAMNLSVRQGQFVTLLGPSGSGKTTLLRMLAGFDALTSGAIFLDGRDVSPLPPARRGIGMVFQHYALFPHMTVRDNIGYGLKMRGWRRNARDRRIDEMLEIVRLDGMGDRKPKQLSGGQQQRVALARALAPRPALLLMDEPLGALDRALRIHMAEEIRRLHRELGTTTLYVTHDREEALTLSDRIIILRNGRLLADGTPEELYRRPTSEFVAGFFGGHNVLQPTDVEIVMRPNSVGTVDNRWAAVARDGAAKTGGGALGIAIPVRKFTLTQPDDLFIRVQATVVEMLFYGDYMRVTCRTVGRNETLTAWLDAAPARRLTPGAKVNLFSRQDDSVLVGLDN